MVNAVFYLTKTGCQWRNLPEHFARWGTVCHYSRLWKRTGLWVTIHTGFRQKVRVASGRNPQPSAGIIDSQSVKITECSDAILAAIPILSVFSGWGVYLLYVWSATGNPFEGFAAQKYWNVHSIGNLVDVPKFIIGFFNPWEWHEFNGSVLDRFLFSLLLGCLP